MSEENYRIWGAGVGRWGARKFWVDGWNQIWRKHVRTRGTANKLQCDERSLQDRTYCFNRV